MNQIMFIKNAEFYAGFEFVDKGKKKVISKKLFKC